MNTIPDIKTENCAQMIIHSKGIDYICLYDLEDHELISRFNWSLHSQGYAQTTINGKTVLMHRLILGIVYSPGIEVDHIFHNKLDNRRANIRICTRSENSRNSRKIKKCSSKFKGVYWDKNTWHAQIKRGNRIVNLGRFQSENTAGRVYDQIARIEYNEFACLNFPQDAPLPMQLKLSI
jgi:hypothetical protein